uniref:VP3 n=1 Tax=Tarumizu tick virus TaxID=2014339 RepID=A0A292G321_9REOV|nr:VP3 [Tarumizu tick virus]
MFLLRRTTNEFHQCFLSKDNLNHQLSEDHVKDVLGGVRIKHLKPVRVDGLGTLTSSGAVSISFPPGLYARVFPDVVSMYVYEDLLVKFLKRYKDLTPELLGKVQRQASTELTKLYLAKTRSIYSRILNLYKDEFIWVRSTEAAAEEMYLLPALYECARASMSNVLCYGAGRGVIGGTIPIGPRRGQQMELVFRRWLYHLEALSNVDSREYLEPQFRVILPRDYKTLFIGESVNEDGNLSWLSGSISYSTVWLPNMPYDRMVEQMLQDPYPCGCHNILNIPVSHYFQFKSKEDLIIRLWKGVRDTWKKLYQANLYGALDDSRLNEVMIVNRVDLLPDALVNCMFSATISKGVSKQSIENLRDVRSMASAQHMVAMQGWGNWWNYEDPGRHDYRVARGECTAIIGVDDNTPLSVAVRVEIRDPGIFLELAAKEEQVFIHGTTVEGIRWYRLNVNDHQLRMISIQKAPLEITLWSPFVFFSCVWGAVRDERRLDLMGRPIRNSRYTREMFNVLNVLCDRQVPQLSRKLLFSMRSVSHHFRLGGDLQYRFSEPWRRWAEKGEELEAMCVDVWFSCMNQFSEQFRVDPELGDGVGVADNVRVRFSRSLKNLAHEVWEYGGSWHVCSYATTLVCGLFSYYDSFQLDRYDGLKLEDLAITWFGPGARDIEVILKRVQFRNVFCVPETQFSFDQFGEYIDVGGRHFGLVIVNYPFDWLMDGDYIEYMRRLSRLCQVSETVVIRVRFGVGEFYQALSARLQGGKLNVMRIGGAPVPTEWLITWVPGDTNIAVRAHTLNFIQKFATERRVISRAFIHEEVDLDTWIRRTLGGEYLLPYGIEVDVSVYDCDAALRVMTAICRNVKARCFKQGNINAYRLFGYLDIDMVLRNARIQGNDIEIARMDVDVGMNLIRALSPSLVSASEAVPKLVNVLNALQAATNFVIRSWVNHYLLNYEYERYYILDVGGRRGELSGWFDLGPRLSYFCIDPNAREMIPKGRIVRGRRGVPERWNFNAPVADEAHRILETCGVQLQHDGQVICIFSNVLSNAYETLVDPQGSFQRLINQIDRWEGAVFIRDMCTFHGQINREGTCPLPAKLCESFVFDAGLGFIPSAYPRVRAGIVYEAISRSQRLHSLSPCCREIYDVLHARGLYLDQLGEFLLPILLAHVVYVGTG